MNRICILLLASVCAESEFTIAQQQVVPDAILPDAVSAQTTSSISFQVLKSWKADFGSHSITYNRVVAPILPAATPTPTPAPQSPEYLQWLQIEDQKSSQIVNLSATVYDHQYTELRWVENNQTFLAFSNIDFNYFRGTTGCETADTIYTYNFGIGDYCSEAVPQGDTVTLNGLAQASVWLTNLSISPASPSAYIIVQGSPSGTTMSSALDVMHAYFDANRVQLIQAYQQRMASNAAQLQWAKDHPPVQKDTVVNFWPKASATNPTP